MSQCRAARVPDDERGTHECVQRDHAERGGHEHGRLPDRDVAQEMEPTEERGEAECGEELQPRWHRPSLGDAAYEQADDDDDHERRQNSHVGLGDMYPDDTERGDHDQDRGRAPVVVEPVTGERRVPPAVPVQELAVCKGVVRIVELQQRLRWPLADTELAVQEPVGEPLVVPTTLGVGLPRREARRECDQQRQRAHDHDRGRDRQPGAESGPRTARRIGRVGRRRQDRGIDLVVEACRRAGARAVAHHKGATLSRLRAARRPRTGARLRDELRPVDRP